MKRNDSVGVQGDRITPVHRRQRTLWKHLVFREFFYVGNVISYRIKRTRLCATCGKERALFESDVAILTKHW